MTVEAVQKVFDSILEPKLKWNINTLGLLKEVEIEGNKVVINVDLVTEDEVQISNFRRQVEDTFAQFYKGELVLNIGRAGVATRGLDGVAKIIFVASGKGGVGKSTVAVNLSVALQKSGYKVGLLDADIYGPSVPIMMGEFKKPTVMQEEYLEPIVSHGVKFISIGSVIDRDKAVAWRGNLVSGTIMQFIKKTHWGDLDFLVLDMPPGTGDIHLTVASQIKPNGIVMVTTPQEVVWGDVKRSLDQIKDQKFPIVGFIENMSYTICKECGATNHPFHAMDESNYPEAMPVLAKIPLVRELSEAADSGVPIVEYAPDSEVANVYMDLAKKVAEVE
jgi:ATP-binding protein involved in chromosome partitioning